MSKSYKIKRVFTVLLAALFFISGGGFIWAFTNLAKGDAFALVWLAAFTTGLIMTGFLKVADIFFADLVDKILENEKRSVKNEKRSKSNKKAIKGE